MKTPTLFFSFGSNSAIRKFRLILTKKNSELGIVVTAAVLISSSVWMTGSAVTILPSAMAQPAPTATCDDLAATIVGTQGDDNIVGTPNRDIIAGLGGNDRIDGLGGNDEICGNDGNDVIFGGAGDDIVGGNTGNDKMDGSSGNHNLKGFDVVVNNDNLDGGTGTDICGSDPDPEVMCEIEGDPT